MIREPFYHDCRTRPVKHLFITYPDQETFPTQEWRYDAEALFVDDRTLYVSTEHRKGQQITVS